MHGLFVQFLSSFGHCFKASGADFLSDFPAVFVNGNPVKIRVEFSTSLSLRVRNVVP